MKRLLLAGRGTVRISLVLAVLAMAGSMCLADESGYWFERYELAVDLLDEERFAEAEPLLEGVIKDHPVPRTSFRIPGNRSIFYLPYLQRARMEYQQGKFNDASRSLEVSRAFGAVTQNRRQLSELQELEQRVNARLADRNRYALTSSGDGNVLPSALN